jgi:5'-methylthioadenosine nucleosidase
MQQKIKSKKPFLIVMAMEEEAELLIKQFELKLQKKPFGNYLPMKEFHGQLPSGRPIYLVLPGKDRRFKVNMVGTQLAAVTSALSITKYMPSAVFNFGTCGALKSKSAKIGDVFYCTDRVWFHSKRIPLPGYDEFRRGGYPCAVLHSLKGQLDVKPGVLSTTDSLDFCSIESERFFDLKADIADMEGAAIAWMADLNKVPFYALKSVADLMDIKQNPGDQFLENLQFAVKKLTEQATKLLRSVDNASNPRNSLG